MAGVILLSAGLDSTVALAQFLLSEQKCLALTIDYGQRSAKQEITRSKLIAEFYAIEHKTLTMQFLAEITKTSLVNTESDVPQVEEAYLDCVLTHTLQSAERVWVPNRNGLFINLAAALAESLGYKNVVTGFNAEEAATFPDNSPQFLYNINLSLSLSTMNQVQVSSPTLNLNKMEIVRLGLELNIPWQYLWSCYHGGEQMCGSCESCARLKRALRSQGEHATLKRIFD